MSRRRKKCRCCHELFQPHPQTYRQQITCLKKACRARRRREKWRRWREKNPLYSQSRRGKQKRWRQERGAAYMRRYRKEHVAYETENRRRQQERDRKRRNLVKPTEWGVICREKARQNRSLRLLVKPTEWVELLFHELDDIWGHLDRFSILVKPTDIDRRG